MSDYVDLRSENNSSLMDSFERSLQYSTDLNEVSNRSSSFEDRDASRQEGKENEPPVKRRRQVTKFATFTTLDSSTILRHHKEAHKKHWEEYTCLLAQATKERVKMIRREPCSGKACEDLANYFIKQTKITDFMPLETQNRRYYIITNTAIVDFVKKDIIQEECKGDDSKRAAAEKVFDSFCKPYFPKQEDLLKGLVFDCSKNPPAYILEVMNPQTYDYIAELIAFNISFSVICKVVALNKNMLPFGNSLNSVSVQQVSIYSRILAIFSYSRVAINVTPMSLNVEHL